MSSSLATTYSALLSGWGILLGGGVLSGKEEFTCLLDTTEVDDCWEEETVDSSCDDDKSELTGARGDHLHQTHIDFQRKSSILNSIFHLTAKEKILF